MHAYDQIITLNNYLQREERHHQQRQEHEKDSFQVDKRQPPIITAERLLNKGSNSHKLDNFGKALIIGLGLLILLR
jgi:hypothetical protein